MYLKVNNLSFAYGDKNVLSAVNFDVKRGESLGIIGPNASGKTTLLRIMSGVYLSLQGEVLYRGKSLSSFRKKELAKIFAFVEQEGVPPLTFTIEEVVAMGRYPWLKPFSGLSKKDYKIIEHVLLTLDIWDKRKQPVNALSGGERQLVALALAMAQEPKVLFLDEPTTYLDIGHQLSVMQYVRNWQKEKELTVIIVLHDLNLAAKYSDRLLLMNQGTIQKIGAVSDVITEQEIEIVYKTKPIMIQHPTNKVPQIIL